MKSFPEEFINRAKDFAGNEFEEFIKSLSEKSPVSIRINPSKKSDEIPGELIPWSGNGKYLSERPSFTLDPFFHAGCYYVQEASSQFLEQPFLQAKKILDRPIRVLDLCAAPGGKSTHLLSLMNENDLLVSNEIIPSRNNILRQNIMKWGYSNVIVTQNDPADFSKVKSFFDIILIDAPCSGEGLFRKDEAAIDEWSEENVHRCSIRQKEILNHAYESLSDDGFIIYSTCTYEKSENDEQVKRLVDEYSMEPVDIENALSGVIKTNYGLSFMPHRIRGEGFYISMLRKGKQESVSKKSEQKKTTRKYIDSYLIEPDRFVEYIYKDRLFAIPAERFSDFEFLQKKLYIRLAGIDMGEFKGNDFIPSEGLALSNNLRSDLNSSELYLDSAIDFLRGNPVSVDSENGFCLIKYKQHNLGWVKKIGGRVNNYYPKEWRIRKS